MAPRHLPRQVTPLAPRSLTASVRERDTMEFVTQQDIAKAPGHRFTGSEETRWDEPVTDGQYRRPCTRMEEAARP
ncbi:hypothetical protein ADK58_28230 [Streptomyces sp. XY152]|nr:hypothetical protein ADK58_28230 [Streptomyces sp. XY152]